MRARRIEFAAGVAACALSLLAFTFVLFAPIVPLCASPASPAQPCPGKASRYVPVVQAASGPVVWLFVLAMLALSLAGGLGAIIEARTGRRAAAVPLWAATILVFAGCALAVSGVGLIYLPSVLALVLAAYASVLPRLVARTGQPRPDARRDDRV